MSLKVSYVKQPAEGAFVVTENTYVAKYPDFISTTGNSKTAVYESINGYFGGVEQSNKPIVQYRAVYNERNGTVVIQPIKQVEIIPNLPQEDITSSGDVKLRELCSIFGSRRIIQAIEREEKRRINQGLVNADEVKKVITGVENNLGELKNYYTQAEMATAISYSSLPPFSTTAVDKRMIYPINGLICLREFTYVLNNFYADELSKFCLGKFKPAKIIVVVSRKQRYTDDDGNEVEKDVPTMSGEDLDKFNKVDNRLRIDGHKFKMTKEQVNEYLNNTENFLPLTLQTVLSRNGANMEGEDVEDINKRTLIALLDACLRFFKGVAIDDRFARDALKKKFDLTEKPDNTMFTAEKRTSPVLPYTIILALHLNEFTLNLTDFATDIKRRVDDIIPIARSIGCLVKTDGKKCVASLSAPLKITERDDKDRRRFGRN